MQFVRYGTKRSGQTMSGAYLFLPDGPAQLIPPRHANHHVRIIRGSIRSQVVVHLPFVVHQVTMHHSPGRFLLLVWSEVLLNGLLFLFLGSDGVGLHIDNLVNLAGQANLEVAMRLVSDVKSDRAFYTDLNGIQVFRFLRVLSFGPFPWCTWLQMTRRVRWDKLPLQAQFYPMPTMAYIEDSSARLSLVGRQPLGAASLASGQLEVGRHISSSFFSWVTQV